MIRAATHLDVPGIVAVMKHAYGESLYVEYGKVDEEAAELLVRNLLVIMGSLDVNSSLVWVAAEGKTITGLMMAMRQRTYHIGTTRSVQEIFWCGNRKTVSPRDMVALYRRFVCWAESDPKVIEIKSSTSDIFRWQDWRELRPFYEKRGFALSGEVFVRRIRQ